MSRHLFGSPGPIDVEDQETDDLGNQPLKELGSKMGGLFSKNNDPLFVLTGSIGYTRWHFVVWPLAACPVEDERCGAGKPIGSGWIGLDGSYMS
jgi:hypothetical protein